MGDTDDRALGNTDPGARGRGLPMGRGYTRWTESANELTGPGEFKPLTADILGAPYTLTADTQTGKLALRIKGTELIIGMDPDEARMLGVRLIEGAALADGVRAIRQAR